MERRTVGILTAVAVAVSVMLTVFPVGIYLMRLGQAEESISVYIRTTEQMEAAEEIRWLNLARWYNFCLRRNVSQRECQEAYEGILQIDPGIMGYLDMPAGSIDLPIYHNESDPIGCYGAEHVKGSAFPVGGTGNHTILTIPGIVSKLEPGDTFTVHILNQRMCYQVERVQRLPPGRTEGILPSRKEDRCTLIATVPQGLEQQKLLIHGIRSENIALPNGGEQKHNLLLLCILHASPVLMLPVVAGGVGKALNWLGRKRNCGRSTNPAS